MLVFLAARQQVAPENAARLTGRILDGLPDEREGLVRLLDFYDKLRVSVLSEIYGDGVVQIANVPEDPPLFSIISARGDNPGNIRSWNTKTLYAFRSRRPRTDKVLNWNFQPAFECPQFVPTFDLYNQFVF